MPEGVDLTRHREPFAVNWNERLAQARAQALGLPWSPAEPSPEGEVWTAALVVRLSARNVALDRREASNAERACELGATAPVCFETSTDASVWSRLPGKRYRESGQVNSRYWRDLCRDLARLHALPATNDAFFPIDSDWHALAARVPKLDPSELRLLSRISSETPTSARLAFCHTQVTASHLMVGPIGEYRGLIDWRHAGWWPPERDYAMLPPDGLREAIDWPFEPVDWSLVATLRVVDKLEKVANGAIDIIELHEAMGFWELMR